jgi:hypothetical protein
LFINKSLAASSWSHLHLLQCIVKINFGKFCLRNVRVPRGWRYGLLAGISERGNQFLVSENQTNCYYLRSWYLFRDNCSPWSYVRVKVEMQFSSVKLRDKELCFANNCFFFCYQYRSNFKKGFLSLSVLWLLGCSSVSSLQPWVGC